MTNFDKILQDVKNELSNEECVKQYFYNKNIIANDEDIKRIDEEMRQHQKMMCLNKENPEIYNQEKTCYEELRKQFDNNPILINYQIVKEEVFSLLVDIKQVLS